MLSLDLTHPQSPREARSAVPRELRPYLKCERCGLHRFRRYVVIGEGDLPCDVLFIGEAPGRAENLMARPFVGASGRLLRSAIAAALRRSNRSLSPPRMYVTNTVACRPCNSKRGPNREPTEREVRTCLGRLDMVARLARPRRVVLLGKVAEVHCAGRFPGALCLYHPAYIARRGGEGSSEYQRFVRELQDLFKGTPRRKVLRRRRRRI